MSRLLWWALLGIVAWLVLIGLIWLAFSAPLVPPVIAS